MLRGTSGRSDWLAYSSAISRPGAEILEPFCKSRHKLEGNYVGMYINGWVMILNAGKWKLLHDYPGSPEKFSEFMRTLDDVSTEGLPQHMHPEMEKRVSCWEYPEYLSLRDAADAYRKAVDLWPVKKFTFGYSEKQKQSFGKLDPRRCADPLQLSGDNLVRYVFDLDPDIDIDSCGFIYDIC